MHTTTRRPSPQVIPAFVSDVFGSKISAATHGVMIGVWAMAAVIGIPSFTSYTSSDFRVSSGGAKITNPSAYISNVHWLCALPAAGFFAALFINVRAEDRALRVAKCDWRVRVFSVVLRVNLAEGGFTVLGPAAQTAEFAALVAARKAAAADAAVVAAAAETDELEDVAVTV